MPRAALTVAEVFRRYGDTFGAEVGAALSTAHSRVRPQPAAEGDDE